MASERTLACLGSGSFAYVNSASHWSLSRILARFERILPHYSLGNCRMAALDVFPQHLLCAHASLLTRPDLSHPQSANLWSNIVYLRGNGFLQLCRIHGSDGIGNDRLVQCRWIGLCNTVRGKHCTGCALV